MTELWTCTDCGAEVDFDQRREHLKDEHGVSHTIPAPECGRGAHACERAKALEANA